MSDLYERTLPTDRWPNRAVSPTPFDASIDDLPVVLVGPGWGKKPEALKELLFELDKQGFRAIGLDTRYGYADQGLDNNASVAERMRVGTSNPYFEGLDCKQNRYLYRRPTGLLQACVELDIEPFAYVGHSDAVRTGLLATQADHLPLKPERMVLINGVGTGDASGIGGMAASNIQALLSRSESQVSLLDVLASFRDSALHFITHPRRTSQEARVIRSFDAWPIIAQLALSGTVTVINSRQDRLISFDDAERRAQEHSEATFIAVDGSHSSIYEPEVRNIIVSELTK